MKHLQALIFSILCAVFLQNSVFSQPFLLQSGPMVGYAEMREVALWAQTNAPAEVNFVYWDSTNPDRKFRTASVLTARETACTAHCIADSIQPGKVYFYELHINNMNVPRPYLLRFQSPKLWQWRGDPPTFSFAVGSCLYINEPEFDRPGKPYGSDYEILTSIYKKHPDLMIWLGDNTYMREPDWNTRTGILYRNTHTRSLPELQPLLASTSQYAIWDDHDYGPNDSDKGFWNKEQTLDAFKLFWANPSYGINGKPGVTTKIEWADVDFFLLDDRYYRSANHRNTGERTMIGEEQFQWLIDELTASQAKFKVVAIGGQVLNDAQIPYESYFSCFPEERKRLIETITAEGTKGVIFLSGDRHHTELSKLERKGTYPLYDFTISPLTAGSGTQAQNEPNTLRVPGTFVGGVHNFAQFEVSGIRTNRVLKCTIFDKDGKEVWSRTLTAKELE